MLLRDMIDLEATQGGLPGEAKPAAEGARSNGRRLPRRRCRGRRCPSCRWCALAPRRRSTARRATAEGAAEAGDEDDDENALSLSALEEKLKPEVLRTFDEIDKVYIKKCKGAEPPPVDARAAARSPAAEFEKSYEKHRKKIVELVRTVHINTGRIEQLSSQLYDLNRR